VDASSAKKADEFTALLRKTLTETPLKLPQVQHSPAETLTLWLSNPESIPNDLEIGDECKLLEPGDEGSLVRCRRQDLGSKEITTHLKAGKNVVKLAMTWDEKISFILADDLSIKRLKYSEELMDDASEKGDGDAATQFDADFTLMALEIGHFIPRVIELFGGEVIE
jgi:recombination associated protein RdgC